MRRPVDPQLATGRRAVAALFLLNAMAFANVVPRLPAVKSSLGLSNTALGLAVAAMPVGALLSGPAAGALVARFGSGTLATACATGMGLVLPLFAVAPAWGVLAGTFLVLGVLDSLMDVSMNAHALRVQRGYGRSIINSLHGLWSIGAVVGAATGAMAAGRGIGLGWHLAAAGGVIVGAALLVHPHLLRGPDDPADAPDAPDDPAITAPAPPRRAGVGRRLALLGVLVVLSAAIEDAPQSWGAIVLREELGTSVGAAGLVFLGFQTAMTVGRLVGDAVVDRFGAVVVIRAGGLLTAVGVGVGLAAGEPAPLVAGFTLAGLGTAPLFPLVFHAAGELPGVSTGHGVAAVAWMGRIGFLAAPPIVGVVGDAISVRAGLLVVPAAGALVAGLAGLVGPPAARPRPYDR